MGATILLIDYDPCSICRIREILSAAGFQSIVAHDGNAGIEAFERYRPDLALIQDLIPKKHGFDVCREIKKTEHGVRVPVVLLAHVRNGRRYAVLATGCDDYVEKPLDRRVLVDKIRRLLPPPEPEAERKDAALDAMLRSDAAEQGDAPRAEESAAGSNSPRGAETRARRRPRRSRRKISLGG